MSRKAALWLKALTFFVVLMVIGCQPSKEELAQAYIKKIAPARDTFRSFEKSFARWGREFASDERPAFRTLNHSMITASSEADAAMEIINRNKAPEIATEYKALLKQAVSDFKQIIINFQALLPLLEKREKLAEELEAKEKLTPEQARQYQKDERFLQVQINERIVQTNKLIKNSQVTTDKLEREEEELGRP